MILNAIKQMERASRNDPTVISLAQGIPFQPSHDGIRAAATAAIELGQADRYSDPQGLPELREAVASQLAASGMAYGANEVVITAGAIEALNTALHTFVTADRKEVVMPVPVYSAYGRCVQLAGGTVIPVSLDEAQGWKLDLAALRARMSAQTAAILICNPNNPTGTVYDAATLAAAAAIAEEYDCMLIIDEVYGNMLYDDIPYYSPAMDSRYKQRIIRIVSFSKDFALTGWRVGYLHTDERHIAGLLAVHDTLINCAPVVSQYAALAAVRLGAEILAANRIRYAEHRRLMTDYLQQLYGRVSYTMPEGAYFFFVRIEGVRDTTAFCLDLLREQHVAVVPGADFGPGGEGHVRICFGRSTEAIHTGMQRFVAYIKEHHGA